DLGRKRLPGCVHAEDRRTAGRRREGHGDVPAEAARAKQRRVEHVESVRRGDADHATALREAVELDEDLVQRLLALAVCIGTAASPADGVDLVDEDHSALWPLTRLLEKLAHPARADADDLLDEVAAARGEERHARFAGERLRQERLAGPGIAVEHDPRRHLRSEVVEPRRVAEELHDLAELLDGLVDAR